VPLYAWTVILGSILYGLTYFHLIAKSAWFLWPIFILIVIPLNLPFLRRYFTQHVFTWFRGVLPPMSVTEREAIEAGDVWWEKEIFQGKPHWQQLLKMPKSQLSIEEQSFVENQVEKLCSMLDDWRVTHEDSDLSPEAWEYIKSEKFFGMIIPKEYGGLEFSPLAHSTVIMKISTRSVSAAVSVMVPNSLGPAELLLHYGTEKQKNYYLPRLANGNEIPCFALTGPEAGSDAGSIPDKGIVCKGRYEGLEVLGIRITFDKRYITLAPIATLFGLAFKLFDPDKLLGDKTELGVTLCLIPTNHPGVEIGNRHFPLNMAFMNGPIRGTDVFVPLEWIIGGAKMAGHGWQMLMECLAAGRGISLPALSTATGILAYRMSGAYAAVRRQFGLPIGQFEGVDEALARIAGLTYTMQAVRTLTADAIGQGIKPAVATAIAKYHMTEMSRKVMNDAMDIHGGRGIMLGPSNYLGRGYQGIPVSITVEGANILTRSLIIFGQGAIRCHPYAKDEMLAAKLYETDQKKALKLFDKNFIKHTGYFISTVVRCLTLSLTRGRLSMIGVNDETHFFIKKINWLSSALALTSDIALMTLGGNLKRKEKLSARLGDILSQLYIASTIIKYYRDQGRQYDDWPMAKWALQTCLYQVQTSFYGLFENYPIKGVGILLKWIIFPFGCAFTLPKDNLAHECVQYMLTLSGARKRLTDVCYIGTEETPVGLMEETFNKLIACTPIMSKIYQAIKRKEINKNLSFDLQVQAALVKKILTHEEVETLKDYEAYRIRSIAVDEFTPDYALGSQIECKTNNKTAQTG
jgi:alkylation response protein AidB-like acyl-CoA dehydrogenase